MKAKTLLVAVVVIAAVAVAGAFGYRAWLQNQAEQRVAEFEARIENAKTKSGETPVEVEYGDVEVGWTGTPVTVHDVAVAVGDEAPTVIEKFVIVDFDRANEPPNHMHIRALGVAQDLSDMGEQQAALLKQLGYNTVRGSYEMSYDYDPKQRVLELRQLRGDVDDMAGIGLELRLSNFDLNKVGDEQQAFPEFSVDEFTITYRDASLMRRIISAGAKEQGVTEEQFIAQLLLDVEAQAGDDQLMQQVAQELRTFLKDPQQLTISARPDQAVAIMELMATAMMKPDDLAGMLNLEVKAN